MRKNLVFVILQMVFISMALKSQTDSCNIRFYIEGMSAGKIKLIGAYTDQNYLADSTVANELGYFEFKRKNLYKPGYFYIILPDYTNIHMMVDKDQDFVIRTKKSDLFGSAKIEGSIENELLFESIKMQLRHEQSVDSMNNLLKGKDKSDPLNIAKEKLMERVTSERKDHLKMIEKDYPNNFYTIFKLAGQNPDLVDVKKPNGDLDTSRQLEIFRSQFWDNVDFTDERLLFTPVIANKLKTFINDLTLQNPDSIIRQVDFVISKSLVNLEMFKFISNWVVIKYQPTKTSVMDGEAVFVYVIKKYFNKALATWYNDKELADVRKKAFEMEASLLNRIGPDVVSEDQFGKTKSIYEIQSPYIIVFMFDTKCEHCQKETPLLKEFHDQWKSKGVEIFSIVLNSSEKEWTDFIALNKLQNWVNVRDPTNRSIYGKYFVDITPELYVLNKDRMIIGKNLKVEQVASIIERDMKKNNSTGIK